MVEQNKILEVRHGSWAYGLNTPESDVDTRAIFIPNKEYILGNKKVEQYESGTQDFVAYALGKYIRLARDANPNIIEFSKQRITWRIPKTLLITNNGSIDLDVKITSDEEWISITNENISIFSTETKKVFVKVINEKLKTGLNTGYLTLTSQAGMKKVLVKVLTEENKSKDK